MRHRYLRTMYWVGFLFSFQIALTVYINSSFLGTKIPESLIGILYTASAILSVMGLFLVPRLINRFGTRSILGFFMVMNIGNILGMILSPNIAVIATCFVLYFSFNTMLYLGLDILVEHWSETVNEGKTRGLYLTAVSLGFMLSPFISGFITDRLGYSALYAFGIVLMIPIIIIISFQLPSITNTHSSKANILTLAHKFIRNKNLGSVFIINFILQFFYAWMVIYTPIYLHEAVGIPWDKIGLLFTIMLSAYVSFEYLFGRLADRFHIERVFMGIGLAVMGISTMLITRAPLLSFGMLAVLFFITRVGGSIVEVMTESYFFKHVHHDDTGTIGFFRNTYPFAYIIAPLVASIILGFAPLWTLFIVLGIICLVGIVMIGYIKKPIKKLP